MKELPSRSTRGKRMSELIGEEADMDSLFWDQPFFQETKSDNEY